MKALLTLALLLCLLLMLTTCTGCAGFVLKPDGTMVAYAVGQSQVDFAKEPEKRACTYGTDPVPAVATAPGRTLVYSSSEPRKQCIQSGSGVKVSVKGGNLGAGWFGVITTFLLMYFAPVGAVL